uniref:Putative drillipeptide CvEx14.15 n=1 Tax=Clavus sp. n. QL-2020 TaxID=2720206 RepID=A0A6M3HE21_9CAEN|nr:putative drillipeptide precursor CvEx14.15 [Clavus sp. n. QL-2020]
MAAMKGVFFICMIVLLITACLGSPHERNTRESEREEERSLRRIVLPTGCGRSADCGQRGYCFMGRCNYY